MDESRLSLLVEELHLAQKHNNLQKEIDALMALAEFHYNNSNFEKARLSLNNILELDKGFANVYYYLALIDVNEGKFERAIRNLDKELKINSKNGYARELRDKIVIKSNFPVVTILLVLMNLGVFFFTFPSISLVDSIVYGLSSFNLNVFNVFTSLFFHVNVFHFLVNMIILVSFGLILEKNIGSLKFLFVYLVCGMVGNFFEVYLIGEGIVVGASAALFGVLGL